MKKTLTFLVLILLLFSPVFAKIYQVPSAFIANIQGGINVAKDGDTVLVMPGIYYENINFKGKNILVASNFIFDEDDSTILETIIDGGNKASVVTFNSGEDSTACILGFTIRHGSNFIGGGISCLTASPTISHNRIIDNLAAPMISLGGAVGGGIGGALSSAIIEYNEILRNVCTSEEGLNFGAGVCFILDGNPIIRFNLITSNKVDGNGGGIAITDYTDAYIHNNTIVDNTAVAGGGGIFNWLSSPGTNIVNNIVSFNSEGIRSESLFNTPGIIPTLAYNDIIGNAEGNFFGFSPDVGDTTRGFNRNGVPCDSFHNIIRDPLFVDTANFDFHLLAYSPCIDAGDPSSPLDPDTTIADIGAFYYPHTPTLVKDDEQNLPQEYELSQNYPNPFNPTTTIPYTVSGSQFMVRSPIHTTLKVYNILGQLVRSLVDEEKIPGNYDITWDGKDNSGKQVASGTYFYQLKTKDVTATKKMVLLR